MGASPYGKLVFGFSLGGAEGEWEFEEAEDGTFDPEKLSWLVPSSEEVQDEEEDGDDEEHYISSCDFSLCAEKHLRVQLGGLDPEDGWEREGYFKRRQAADAKLAPVELIMHGYHEDPGHALVAFELSSEWGEVTELDLPSLEQQRLVGDWDAKLVTAINTLGITPTQEGPRWLLLAKYF